MKPISLLQRFLRPSSWPINGKLAFAFLISALIPIILTAHFGFRDTLDNVRQSRLKELQQLAATTAGRIDLLVSHASRSVRALQRNQDIRQLLQGKADAATSTRTLAQLKDLLSSNEDVQEVLILDAKGMVLLSSSSSSTNRMLGPIPVRAAQGNPRGVVAGITAFGDEVPTLLVATPVLGADGAPLGRVVLKLVPGAIDALLAESTLRGRAVPFVVDDLGVILQHADAQWLHTSLGVLTDADKARARDERRYGANSDSANIRSLGATSLAAVLRESGSAGHLEHPALFTGSEEATGYAPILSLPWMVGVTESRSRWEAPLREVYLGVIVKVFMVAALAALAGVLIFARDLVQPIRRLIRSAQMVKAGDYAEARVKAINEDEIGELIKTFNTMIDSIEKRDHERDLFGRMVSPEVREKLLSGKLVLGGENRKVAVLFSDIRDFTTLCEGMRAAKVVEMLNEYMTEMTAAVKPWSGYVNNFMGDAIMVVFGAPYEHPDSAWGAVQAAFDMRVRLDELNRRRLARGDAPIAHGIGIASGIVVAGQMGSIERFQYTVIGDAVNVASRLESITKEYPDNPILATADIVAEVRSQTDVVIVELDERLLKGRSQATRLYSLARKA